jgi:hypothetical protein
MSKRTHALVLVAMVAAMNLAGLTAIAQAQPPDTVEQFRRGERASQQDRTATDAVERFRQSERASQQQPTTAEAVEEFRRGERASQEQTAADATLQRVLARERFSIPSQTPDQPTAPAPPEPSGQPSWLVASLGGLAAALALIAGLVVLVAKRAGRRARVGHAA